MIITIDGPAGAGKSTISKKLASELGFIYLDTGAMYRACALYMLRKGVDIGDESQVIPFLDEINIRFDDQKIFLNSQDVTEEIRTPEIDQAASKISKLQSVREKLTRLQRQIAKGKNIVAEGRDMGTVVFPDAQIKIFLTASAEERAKRRKKQLEEAGQMVSYEIILHQIKKRDKADSTREIAPLKPASDAVVIDSTNIGPEDVILKILKLYKKEEHDRSEL